jgi:hypothetical protein
LGVGSLRCGGTGATRLPLPVVHDNSSPWSRNADTTGSPETWGLWLALTRCRLAPAHAASCTANRPLTMQCVLPVTTNCRRHNDGAAHVPAAGRASNAQDATTPSLDAAINLAHSPPATGGGGSGNAHNVHFRIGCAVPRRGLVLAVRGDMPPVAHGTRRIRVASH